MYLQIYYVFIKSLQSIVTYDPWRHIPIQAASIKTFSPMIAGTHMRLNASVQNEICLYITAQKITFEKVTKR